MNAACKLWHPNQDIRCLTVVAAMLDIATIVSCLSLNLGVHAFNLEPSDGVLFAGHSPTNISFEALNTNDLAFDIDNRILHCPPGSDGK